MVKSVNLVWISFLTHRTCFKSLGILTTFVSEMLKVKKTTTFDFN